MDAENSLETVVAVDMPGTVPDAPPDGLMQAAPPPAARWVVPALLAEGVTVLAGEAKSGKSWLALDLAVAVASGGLALGSVACPLGNVLHVDLENGERRIEERLHALIGGRKTDLSRLKVIHEPPTEKSFVELLDAWHAGVADPRLAVIDAAQRFGPISGARLQRRELREKELGIVQQWALRRGIAVLAIARGDKESAASDETLGIADATLLLDRKAGQPTLTISSRDMGRRKLTLAFDAGRWSIVDPGDGSRRDFHRGEILAVLKSSAWAMAPRHVAKEIGISVANARQTLSRMARDGEIARWSRGEYFIPRPDLRFGTHSSPHRLPPELQDQWFQRDRGDSAKTGRVRRHRSMSPAGHEQVTTSHDMSR